MEAKRIYLTNDNNRLGCDAFLQIHFAPLHGITESQLSQVFVVNANGTDRFLKMVSMIRIPFEQISSVMTLPASGKESDVWKEEWKKTYPSTNDITMMAVYMYKGLDE